ncbi:unnamed protein product [Ilex paraguariensis]|uniref:Uncharacterized protein n=1 Tax=Ilex paraguariensis TaxID=185542 RepID=A0ABC8RTG0_9AQUA
MADIVKMGRPQGKSSSAANALHQSVNHHRIQGALSTASHHDLNSSGDGVPKVLEMHPEPGFASAQHISSNDEWPLIEQPPDASVPSGLESPPDSELHLDTSNLPFDRINQHPESQADEVSEAEDSDIENLGANHVGPASVSSRKMQEDNSGDAALYDNDLYRNMGSYQHQNHAFEHQEVEDVGVSVSSVTC